MTQQHIHTIGHSNHNIEVFIAMLKDRGVTAVVDVRSTPSSRFQPHFNRAALHKSLHDNGITYKQAGDVLGGRCEIHVDQPIYREYIRRLLKLATTEKVCIMCAEKTPKDCHRAYKISPVLLSIGVKVTHITPTGDVCAEQYQSTMPKDWVVTS